MMAGRHFPAMILMIVSTRSTASLAAAIASEILYSVTKMCLVDFWYRTALASGSAEAAMTHELVRNEWGVISSHADAGLLELRWLPSTVTMTDGGFMATLCLFASEAEKARPTSLLIDATEFRHRFGEGVMAWRDAHIIPRYGAAGVRRFAFLMPAGFPNAGSESVEGPAIFPTKWFTDAKEALTWLTRREG